jgi:hypothetical protein
MGDDNIKAVLKRAADDPAFLQCLLVSREAALKDAELAPHERQMLLLVSNHQLEAMVKQVQRPLARPAIAAAGCLTAAAVGVLLFTATGGVRPEVAEAWDVKHLLHEIAVTQERYRVEYGQYGSVENLRRQLPWLEATRPDRYVYDITLSADTFTATARHKERPDTRKAFTVGPDGVVKELPRDGGQQP